MQAYLGTHQLIQELPPFLADYRAAEQENPGQDIDQSESRFTADIREDVTIHELNSAL
ncbi:hypothetical protein [Rhodococcus sp. (in: high G+C Gram-positive bacteria)]|uniref:hypothetical protein n=1 Tax=Rhodococcus sp. TaxID=1831 RepID=UPI00257B5741|nr:hypothetical protein [Rhodococcus sp. (in: high G+C Gram-positive bacteria)]